VVGRNDGSSLARAVTSVGFDGRLRIIANDGFNETEQVVEPIIVNAAPPVLNILSPTPGVTFPDSTPIRLRAAAFGDGDAPLSGDQIRWSLDGGGVGTGQEVEVRELNRASISRKSVRPKATYQGAERSRSAFLSPRGSTGKAAQEKTERRKGIGAFKTRYQRNVTTLLGVNLSGD
jgi:hypothetical protein